MASSRVAAIGVTTLILCSQALAQNGDRKDFFAWFDSLGYTKDLKLPFVEYSPIPIHRGFIGQAGIQFGFELSASPSQVVVCTTDLTRMAYNRSEGLWPENPSQPSLGDNQTPRIDADFADYARGELKRIKELQPESTQYPYDDWTPELMVLSRAAESRGEDTLSQQVYNEAASLYKAGEFGGKPFVEHAKDAIGIDVYNACCYDFSNPQYDRVQLRNHFQSFLNHFPLGEVADHARDKVRTLNTMIAEDERHHTPTPTQLASMPAHERIQECIFELRNERGDTGYGPAYGVMIPDFNYMPDVSPFSVPAISKNDPAYLLFKAGKSAVPLLIEALDDRKFAMGVVMYGSDPHLFSVANIGGVSLEVIERIAKRSFQDQTTSRFPTEQDMPKIKKEVEAWWNDEQGRSGPGYQTKR